MQVHQCLAGQDNLNWSANDKANNFSTIHHRARNNETIINSEKNGRILNVVARRDICSCDGVRLEHEHRIQSLGS